MLKEAPKVTADAAQIAQPGFSPHDWMIATVPGTVLTTMIDRGVYPDPDYGLNNLAIPESLNKQDYWYRTEFKGPKVGNGQRLTLTFQGINYKAGRLAEWAGVGHDHWRIHSRGIRRHQRNESRADECARRAYFAAAASGDSA